MDYATYTLLSERTSGIFKGREHSVRGSTFHESSASAAAGAAKVRDFQH